MDINEMTIGEAKELARLFQAKDSASPFEAHGPAIVVLDRGFVYVGTVCTNQEFCTIESAKNIRIWGTKKGLGQLVNEGPQSDTKLDAVGTVKCPMRAVISIIPLEQNTWNKF